MPGRPSVGASPTDAPGLPRVLHNAPAAVLVIDLDRQQVGYADTGAIALTGERVGLPVDVDSWSDAARLPVARRRGAARCSVDVVTSAAQVDRSRITSARSAYS